MSAVLVVGLRLGALSPIVAASSPVEPTDAQLEEILKKGKITRKEQIGTGVTKPPRLWIELDGVTVSPSYKSVNRESRGLTRFASGRSELNFTDSFHYERAAYRLDRAIGLGMVPVTVV